ncbi:GNAT family N-acetyltransferase [Flavobacterium sp. LB2R40]|uniref:GNAT family N-acetyltransferase n=1 Tax=unclassified Flavobacterium TaxID=196869 RepID=UPI003AAACBDA
MIQFKPLALADIEIIVQLMEEFYAIDNYPIAVEVSKALFKEFISNEDLGRAWLILEDKVVVGYLILTYIFSFEYQGKIAFLDELYLTEKARGKGIGNKAIAFIKIESHNASLKLIYLELEQHNEKGRKLYLANGFECHHRQLMKYKIK